jgi:hypothetical protein
MCSVGMEEGSESSYAKAFSADPGPSKSVPSIPAREARVCCRQCQARKQHANTPRRGTNGKRKNRKKNSEAARYETTLLLSRRCFCLRRPPIHPSKLITKKLPAIMPAYLPPRLWKRVALLLSQILRIQLLSNHPLQLPLLGGDCFKMIPLHPPKLPLLRAPRLHHSPSFRYFISVIPQT